MYDSYTVLPVCLDYEKEELNTEDGLIIHQLCRKHLNNLPPPPSTPVPPGVHIVRGRTYRQQSTSASAGVDGGDAALVRGL